MASRVAKHSENTLTQTVTGLFDSYNNAKLAVQDLEALGVPHRDISIVASNVHGEHDGVGDYRNDAAERADKAADGAGKGAGIGATVGGVGGLLAGIGLLAIPGLGPVVAAGWLASTAVGALVGGAVGGAAGGLVGALTKEGVPEEHAHVYAEGVRRGGSLVSAKVDDALAPQARSLLSDTRSVDVAARGDAYRQEGWNRFDESAPLYTAEQVRLERQRYNVEGA